MSEELAEIIAEEDGGAIAVREHPVTLWGTDDPVAVIEKARLVAGALADVVNERKLFSVISGKKHVKVEGWQLLASMLGISPQVEWSRPCQDSKGAEGWEARVIATRADGTIVGSREAMCTRSEGRWAKADDYAIRSMATTRAVSGALSMPLRFVMELAGYAGTPEAEMPSQAPEKRQEAGRSEVPRTGAQVKERLSGLLGGSEAEVWLSQVAEYAKGQTLAPTGLQRLAGVVLDLEADGSDFCDFPADDAREKLQACFAKRFDGAVFPGPEWAMNGAEAEVGSPSKEEVLGG